jgi:hypothetical protein
MTSSDKISEDETVSPPSPPSAIFRFIRLAISSDRDCSFGSLLFVEGSARRVTLKLISGFRYARRGRTLSSR